MKILITCDHYAVASGRYAYDALQRMGHDVRSMGRNWGTMIWDIEVDEKYAWVSDPPADGWKPDLVIHMDGNTPPPERLGSMPHVAYGVDNHVREYRHGDFDHLFMGHGNGYRIGEDNATWLPCGYDPLFDGGPKLAERTMDVAILGVMYENRASAVYALLQHLPGIKIQYDKGLLYDEYAAAYRNAKVSLVCSAKHDVAQRVFETAAMGCVVVMDDCPDCEPLGLEHGKNCLLYNTVEELIQRVKWAMLNPEEAQKIANAGKRWAKPQTWDARLQVIVDWTKGQGKTDARAVVEAPEVESETDGSSN